ncbi:MAG: glycosyltransferase family 4 protein [Candidatus Aenigmarchaeota archaeon]|nr:glycosyltransferase family 4 protein [Candidatus Aenigmarchaeota archaeon]
MKILILIENYPPTIKGGAEVSTKIMAEELAKRKINVHVLTRCLNNKKIVEKINQVTVHRTITSLDFFTIKEGLMCLPLTTYFIKKQILSLNKKENFDLFHASGRDVAIGTILAAKKAGIPSIAHIRDYWPICPMRSCIKLYNEKADCKFSPYCVLCHTKHAELLYGSKNGLYFLWSIIAYINTIYRQKKLRKATHIFTVSKFVKSLLLKNKFDSKNIEAIPNILPNIKTIKPSNKKKNNKTGILYIGRLSIEKGIFDLISACSIVYKNNQNIKLRIVGGGPLEKKLKEFVKKNKIKFVEFVGKIPINKVQNEYINCDIVSCPSTYPEPFPRVAIEAAYFKKPMIAYNSGGIPEIVKHRDTGLLVDVGDIKKLADSILELINNNKLREKITKNTEKTRKQCNSKPIIDQIIKTYEKLM